MTMNNIIISIFNNLYNLIKLFKRILMHRWNMIYFAAHLYKVIF